MRVVFFYCSCNIKALTNPFTNEAMSDDEFPNNSQEWLDEFLTQLLVRPLFMTEVRRDGKDNAVIEELIRKEFHRRLALPDVKRSKFSRRYEICS